VVTTVTVIVVSVRADAGDPDDDLIPCAHRDCDNLTGPGMRLVIAVDGGDGRGVLCCDEHPELVAPPAGPDARP
jgi:hypothetical protein